MKKGIIAIIVLGILGVIIVGWYVRTNNNLINMKGQATKQWANVESSYQRRNDLIGNLVKTVQGAADFERETLQEGIEARSRATSPPIDANNLSAAQLAEFQQAQSGLSSALSRLLVTVERYPELRANQNFLELQSQLEGTENRINVARDRYNEAVNTYDIHIKKFPNTILAGWFGFEEMPRYTADAGSEVAPDVNFDFD